MNNKSINFCLEAKEINKETFFSELQHYKPAVVTMAVRNKSGICGSDADLSCFTDICVVLREYNLYRLHCEDCRTKAGIANICLEHFPEFYHKFAINHFGCVCYACFLLGHIATVTESAVLL